MQTNNYLLPWEESAWLDDITSWLKVTLSSHNIKQNGEPQQIHSAPWSVVYEVSTNKGAHFFKALCPVLKHEALLAKQLSLWHPNLVQPVLEVEPERGWLLMPDGGTTLRQVLEKTPSVNYWKKILPQYAKLQQALIPHQQDLLALGVRDRRLKILPDLVKNLVSNRESLCIGQSDGLSNSEYDLFMGVMPKILKLCETLAQYAIPETLQHDDFHDGNIFVVQNEFRFFDWAESFIAHPFFSMVVTLRSIAYRFDLEEDSAELRELETLYLNEWQEYASLKRLREAFELAMVIGRINRALTWHMVVSSLPEPYRTKEADAVPGWVKLFLEKITLFV
ncbi:MAG: hypothetical protein C0410_00500 [Anaerolinea sp.]|nr:hypothetical protein [Anaerolinea sp.]